MNHNLAMRRLIWKEVHQLRPLVVLLPLLGALCHVLFLMGSAIWRLDQSLEQQKHFLVFLGLPGLFAVGAGAMLVGQEKEQRTLNWLSTLPISSGDIVRIKLLVSLSALLLIWLISSLLLLTADSLNGWGSGWWLADDPWVMGTWAMHSLFVLLIGIALAWKLNSSLTSLVLVVPTALLPMLCSWLAILVFRGSTSFMDSPPFLLFFFQLLFSVAAVYFVRRFGHQSLCATTAATKGKRFSAADEASTEFYHSVRLSAANLTPVASLPALTWQFSSQSRAFLLGLTVLLGCGVALIRLDESFSHRTDPGWQSFWGVIFAFTAVCWLGVSSFQGDCLHNRIRFLADRGVNPRLVWWTRHVVPLAIMVGVLLFSIILLGLSINSGSRATVLSIRIYEVPSSLIFGLACFGFVAYSVSQWVSQISFSPIVAAIVAPFVTVGALFFLPIANNMLGAPIWLLALCASIPVIATYGAMSRWMDGRLGISYWSWHTSLVAAWLLIPAIPFVVAIATVPSMPSSVAREIALHHGARMVFSNGELTLLPKTAAVVHRESVDEPVIHALPVAPETESNLSKPSLDQRWSIIRAHLEHQLNDVNVSVLSSNTAIHYLISTALLERSRLESMASTVDPEDKNTIEKYGKCIELLTRMAQRMRLSQHLRDQDFADAVECFLLRELLKPSAKKRLGPTFDSTAKVLADANARVEARRRAIAFNWLDYQNLNNKNTDRMHFGKYEIVDMNRKAGSFENLVVGKRRLGRAVADLWELAKTGEQGATQERLKRIADYWGVSHQRYGFGTGGKHMRPDDAANFVVPTRESNPQAPASLWFAGWERQAKKLLNAD